MASAFDSLDDYIALPRQVGLALSPDGARLITGVATLDEKKVKYVTALWEVDPTGERQARRLTRSAKGEGVGAFTPEGDHLFVSARPEPGADEDDDPKPALWLLPTTGGEARLVATRPGGIGGLAVARISGRVAVVSATLPGAVSGEDDAERRKVRKDRKIAAILHESYPIRLWDHDLGPDEARLLVGEPLPAAAGDAATAEPKLDLRDLTPAPGRALDDAGFEISADGAVLASDWQLPEQGGRRSAIRVFDTATGRVLLTLDDPAYEFLSPVISPDGSRMAVTVFTRSVDGEAPDHNLGLVDLPATVAESGGSGAEAPTVGYEAVTVLTAAWDRWPSGARWSAEGDRLFVVADESGAAPVFAIDVVGRKATRLTGDHGAYSDLCVSPDGQTLYALRTAVDSAPQVVRLHTDAAWQEPVLLRGPSPAPSLPGTLEEVTARAEDGTTLRAWLVLPQTPPGGEPAPLLLWVHGGPLNSWNAWSWRWNPWLAAARGYAVLLPDPALSTGYGRNFIARGWSRWGAEPFTDLMLLTDAALTLPQIDETRTAALGGSFGGYMANWIAGHTDRFRGIVTHASLWALDQFSRTTDDFHYWRREMTPQMIDQYSAHTHIEAISTPMLVIHGDKDYRVPIGEGLRLWAELSEHHSADDGTMPHKFLYFPNENHWILTPQHAVVWYQTVFAFLEHTVHDRPWVTPDTLR
jgi:dipeptidyl aminopeptidase/acylaminoacyl peptidase